MARPLTRQCVSSHKKKKKKQQQKQQKQARAIRSKLARSSLALTKARANNQPEQSLTTSSRQYVDDPVPFSPRSYEEKSEQLQI